MLAVLGGLGLLSYILLGLGKAFDPQPEAILYETAQGVHLRAPAQGQLYLGGAGSKFITSLPVPVLQDDTEGEDGEEEDEDDEDPPRKYMGLYRDYIGIIWSYIGII